MGLYTSPLALGGIALILLAATSLYSTFRIYRRYRAVGAGPPSVVSSGVFGIFVRQLEDSSVSISLIIHS